MIYEALLVDTTGGDQLYQWLYLILHSLSEGWKSTAY